MAADLLLGELRREIADGRVTCIIGAGVSIAASFDPDRKPNVASWLGLLEDGIARCAAVVPGLPPRWPDRMRDMLEMGTEGDTEALLGVAEQITVKLGGPSGGELKRWLRETVGALPVRHPDVPLALAGLGSAQPLPRIADQSLMSGDDFQLVPMRLADGDALSGETEASVSTRRVVERRSGRAVLFADKAIQGSGLTRRARWSGRVGGRRVRNTGAKGRKRLS